MQYLCYTNNVSKRRLYMAGDINFTKDETFDGYVTEKVNVIKNDLLGDYNESGKYIINEQVVLELLKLEKTKHSTFNNSIFCTSYLAGYGEITFELELKKQGNYGIAVIYVLEKVDKVNGYIQNTIKTQIAIYKDVLTPDFIDRSFNGFNVKRLEEQDQRELDPNDFKSSLNTYIGARKHFMDLLDTATADEYNEMYQQYFNQRIAILKEDNSDYARLVLNNYGAEYNKIKDYFLKNEGAVDYKALNELLDKCFEDVNGLDPRNREKEEELKKKMIPYLHALMQQAQAITQKGKDKVVEKAKASEKQKLAQIAKDKEKAEKSKEQQSKPKEKEATVKFTYSKPPTIDNGVSNDKESHPINDDGRLAKIQSLIDGAKEGANKGQETVDSNNSKTDVKESVFGGGINTYDADEIERVVDSNIHPVDQGAERSIESVETTTTTANNTVVTPVDTYVEENASQFDGSNFNDM